MKDSGKKTIINTALKNSIPVLSGYLALGMGFGIVLKAQGYGFFWALAMSVCIFAGSMQFVGINLLTSGASLVSFALTTLMVNARHLFYGISMAEPYRNAGKYKPYLIFALTDETYSLVCTGKGDMSEAEYHRYCFYLSLFDQSYWVSGCVLGSLIGNFLPFPATGIDFALTALFITVFVDQWRASKEHYPALIGVAASVICLLLFGKDSFLIPAMVLISLALCLIGQKKGSGKAADHFSVSDCRAWENSEQAAAALENTAQAAGSSDNSAQAAGASEKGGRP